MSLARPASRPTDYGRHLPALDGVRGLAILMVMASHLFPGTPHNLGERFVFALFEFGASGVDLFFVLSGFLITGILFDSRLNRFFFRNFYARRALRIFPLYYGVLAVFALLGFVRHQSSGGELASLGLYLQNTRWLAPPIWQYRGALVLPLGHFWSLAVEEQFYLVWPLLVFVVKTRRRLLLICATSVVLCPLGRFLLWQHGMEYAAVHSSTLCRADALLLGGALALLLRSRHHDRVLSTARWFAVGLIPVLLLRFLNSASGVVLHGSAALAAWALIYTVLALGYVGLLTLALTPRSRLQTFFKASPLRRLGRYSYGLYVLHLIVLYYGQAPVRAAMQRSHVSPSLVSPLAGMIIFFASFAAAILSYHLYEKPFLGYKRFFACRMQAQPAFRTGSPRRKPFNRLSGQSALPAEIAGSTQ